MMNQEFLTDATLIEAQLNKLDVAVSFISNQQYKKNVTDSKEILHQVQDISGSLRNLKAGIILDDIEFFEIKKFALLVAELRETLVHCDIVTLPDNEDAIKILDPENKRIPRFFIYDEYDERLSHLRKKLRQYGLSPEEKTELEMGCSSIEDNIRQDLSEKLIVCHNNLEKSFEAVTELDYLFAKVEFFISHQCTKPVITNDVTKYQSLFNLEISDTIKKKGKNFQPVDIEIHSSPCIITGANMGGKTVLLKSVALAQYLFQLGFYVPATSAAIVPVEKVLCSFEAFSNSKAGLSSFATEVVRINEIIKQVKNKENVLVLLDEPAQTTNPEEGTAIVSAIAAILDEHKTRSLITTHYSHIVCNCRRLIVRGLKIPADKKGITAANISDFIDYRLEENTDGKTPLNAIQVAGILNVDEQLLSKATEYLNKPKN
jgi:dsDNA-specific endonuclease/ATPase MutS2